VYARHVRVEDAIVIVDDFRHDYVECEGCTEDVCAEDADTLVVVG
jgi:hypothetical protein